MRLSISATREGASNRLPHYQCSWSSHREVESRQFVIDDRRSLRDTDGMFYFRITPYLFELEMGRFPSFDQGPPAMADFNVEDYVGIDEAIHFLSSLSAGYPIIIAPAIACQARISSAPSSAMGQIPIITRQARVALWLALILSIIDLGLSLTNFGLSSLFIGLCATSMSIIHLSTHLIVVSVREKRALRHSLTTPHNNTRAKSTVDAGVFSPTSTLLSISFSIILTVCYLAAFGVSVFSLLSDFVSSLVLTGVVVYFDAIFEVLCAVALVWLAVVGVKERKGYLEITHRIQLEDTSLAPV